MISRASLARATALGLGLCLAGPSPWVGPAAAAAIPWNRGWSGGITWTAVTASGFSDGLESEMNMNGWGVDTPSFTDPFFGLTIPGTTYPVAIDAGSAFSVRLAHAWNPGLDLALSFAVADLGGQTGYDGTQTLALTGAVNSLGVLALFHHRHFQAGGGPTADWLRMDLGSTHETSLGVGVTLHASYDLFVDSPVYVGVVVQQHIGFGHTVGPSAPGSGGAFPAIAASPTYTTFGVELGSRQP